MFKRHRDTYNTGTHIHIYIHIYIYIYLYKGSIDIFQSVLCSLMLLYFTFYIVSII